LGDIHGINHGEWSCSDDTWSKLQVSGLEDEREREKEIQNLYVDMITKT